MSLPESLQHIRDTALAQLGQGADPETVFTQFLGRKGELSLLLRGVSELSLEEKATFGKAANELKQELAEAIDTARQTPGAQVTFSVDRTIPAYPASHGSVHPISAMIEELVGIFQDISFEVVEGPELVTEKENFENLNMGKDHPSRDTQETFYVQGGEVMRTQTSTVQVIEMMRRMKDKQMPIRFVVPGKTYRRESDATHSAMFHQMEGVLVDTQASFADLRGVLDYVAKRLFGDDIETRFRPHFFPFTEPSAEMDIRSKNATGSGKHTQWLEMLGCGMIHPKVLERAGINPKIYQGWAFGMGIERQVMVREQVPDLRKFYENPVSFLNQFANLP